MHTHLVTVWQTPKRKPKLCHVTPVTPVTWKLVNIMLTYVPVYVPVYMLVANRNLST